MNGPYVWNESFHSLCTLKLSKHCCYVQYVEIISELAFLFSCTCIFLSFFFQLWHLFINLSHLKLKLSTFQFLPAQCTMVHRWTGTNNKWPRLKVYANGNTPSEFDFNPLWYDENSTREIAQIRLALLDGSRLSQMSYSHIRWNVFAKSKK